MLDLRSVQIGVDFCLNLRRGNKPLAIGTAFSELPLKNTIKSVMQIAQQMSDSADAAVGDVPSSCAGSILEICGEPGSMLHANDVPEAAIAAGMSLRGMFAFWNA